MAGGAAVSYPPKVQRVVDRMTRSEWGAPAVIANDDDHGTFYVIRAETPGNVFVRRTISVYIRVKRPYTIEGTDIRMRGTARLGGGHVDGFGSHRDLKTWRDVELATYPKLRILGL